MADITEGAGGRFRACTEFQKSGYGQGYTQLTVRDTQTGEERTTTLWGQESKEEAANRLAQDMITTQASMMAGDDKSWTFNVSGEETGETTDDAEYGD